jgi:type II secretory pathway component GspD/PulD (secretin)
MADDWAMAPRATWTDTASELAAMGLGGTDMYQVLIEATVVETTRQPVRVLGIDWLVGQETLLGPDKLERSESGSSSPAFGFNVGGGTEIGGGSGQSDPYENGGGLSTSTGVGVQVPILSSGGGQRSSLVATFAQPNILTANGDAHVVVTLKVGSQPTQKIAAPVIVTTDNEVARVETRRAMTYVTLTGNNTIVVGGLLKSEEEARTKVPLLGDIPLLNRLFRTTERDKERTEVVFLVTPSVVILEESE